MAPGRQRRLRAGRCHREPARARLGAPGAHRRSSGRLRPAGARGRRHFRWGRLHRPLDRDPGTWGGGYQEAAPGGARGGPEPPEGGGAAPALGGGAEAARPDAGAARGGGDVRQRQRRLVELGPRSRDGGPVRSNHGSQPRRAGARPRRAGLVPDPREVRVDLHGGPLQLPDVVHLRPADQLHPHGPRAARGLPLPRPAD
mmetsp:Transcript_41945/g.125463  ORF Transcript_41945/g.125463 Transcript_41945/m.125463 type:complete len:200 (+) Transcript_41945:619-1218(+)